MVLVGHTKEVEYMLDLVYFDNCRFNPTSVLDFLSACIHIPKIWRGRDKKLPKVRFSSIEYLGECNDTHSFLSWTL